MATDKVYLEIHSWVLHFAGDWTEQQAENAIDALDAQIVRCIEANGANKPHWLSLQADGKSNVTLELVGGLAWLHESFPVMAVVGKGTSRQDVREDLAAFLTGAVTAAQAVFAYQPRTFGGTTVAADTQQPVVYVASAGADHSGRVTFR